MGDACSGTAWPQRGRAALVSEHEAGGSFIDRIAPGMVAPEDAADDEHQLHSATEEMALNEDAGRAATMQHYG